MDIKEEMQDGVSQIFLEGRFDANTSEAVESFIMEKIETGVKNFVLNMESVNFTASAGLRVILVVAKKLRNEYEGDLRIAGPQPGVRRVFELSGMDNVLQIFDQPAEAVQSFA